MKRVLALAALIAAGCGPRGDLGRGTQLLVITIDTEALRSRAESDHVERLIYGNFGVGRRAGVDEMMDIADRHGVTLSFFVDVLEERTHPGEISGLVRHIVARGHDVELHTHPEQMPPEFWTEIGVTKKESNTFSRDDATAMVGEALRLMSDWDIPAPIAYRAGGYRYSAGYVQALPDLGFREDYDYNIKGKSQVDGHLDDLPAFTWENGLVEVPISYVDGDRFDDLTYLDRGFDAVYDDIRRFQDRDAHSVLVMMMHSWSMLRLDGESRFFEYDGPGKLDAFDTFLAGLPPFVEVVSARELDARIGSGELTLDTTERTADIFP